MARGLVGFIWAKETNVFISLQRNQKPKATVSRGAHKMESFLNDPENPKVILRTMEH